MNEKQKNVYQAYGRFAIEFEQLVFSMKTCILNALIKSGLKDQKLFRVIMADQTANPIFAKCRAIIHLIFEDEEEELKNLKPLFKLTNNLIEKRNELIHGTSFWWGNFGLKDIESKKDITFLKEKITSTGPRMDALNYDFEELEAISDQIIIVKSIYERISGCIIASLKLGDNVDSSQFNNFSL